MYELRELEYFGCWDRHTALHQGVLITKSLLRDLGSALVYKLYFEENGATYKILYLEKEPGVVDFDKDNHTHMAVLYMLDAFLLTASHLPGSHLLVPAPEPVLPTSLLLGQSYLPMPMLEPPTQPSHPSLLCLVPV